jgi:hypothetical protein
MKGGHKRGTEHAGRWPRPLLQFLWDLLPASLPDRWLPPDDGLEEPSYKTPAWKDSLADDDLETALQAARLAHTAAKERAQTAEVKANRLLTASITLVASALGLAGYQLSSSGPIAWLTIVACGLAALFFTLAGVDALEVDRVGLYAHVTLDSWIELGGSKRALVELEDRGQFLANWTAKHKLTTLMNARAWFSRGLLSVVVAGVLVVAGIAIRKDRQSLQHPARPLSRAPANAGGSMPAPRSKPAKGAPILLPPPARSSSQGPPP